MKSEDQLWAEKTRMMVGRPCEQCARMGVTALFELIEEKREDRFHVGSRNVSWTTTSTCIHCPHCHYRGQIACDFQHQWKLAHTKLWADLFAEQGLDDEQMKRVRAAFKEAVRTLVPRGHSRSVMDSLADYMMA